MLKIVHISTYDNGGAGNAAIRLHLGLLEKGVNSIFLCAKKNTGYKNVVEFSQKQSILKSTFIRTPFNAIGLPIDKCNQNIKTLNKLQGNYELFTFPDANQDILSHPAVINADIIHLHWVAKYLDYGSFFTKVTKPVIWTLHDMNPLQGGFHYFNDIETNKNTFGSVENRLSIRKASLINRCKNLTMVAPSKWLYNLASHSAAFKSAKQFHIPYGIDTGLFKDYGKELSRHVLDLPKDKMIISFVSADIHSKRKGFDLLYEAIKQAGKLNDVVFCAVGAVPDGFNDNNFIHMGSIKDERLMALLYSASDGYVLPSREDNLPNVMIEALCCGTPVLSFAVGGMLDLIQPGFNGEFANEISSASLAEGLKLFITGIAKYDRIQIRQNIIDNYNLSVQANNYLNLYTQTMQGN